MKTRSTTIKAATALMLTSIVWAGAATAQNSEAVKKMGRPTDSAANCAKINWNEEFVGTYPWASEACQTVVTVDGEKWARFEGKFLGVNSDGSFNTEFMSRSNRKLGQVTMMPKPSHRVRLDNKDVRFDDLNRGQILSFYVPEGAVGFAVEPGVAHTELVRVVDSPTDAQLTASNKAAAKQQTLLAKADTQTRSTPTSLPKTASPLPLMALGGLMSMLGGLGFTIRRKSSKRNSQ